MRSQGTRSVVYATLVIAALLVAGCTSSDRGGGRVGANLTDLPSSSAGTRAATTQATSSTPPSTHERTLLPADTTLFPAKGCGPAGPGRYVTFEVAPDGTHPSCLIVGTQQRLRVVNDTNGFPGVQSCTVAIALAHFPTRMLAPGQTTTFDVPFGSVFADGEHIVRMACDQLAGQTGVTIWLK